MTTLRWWQTAVFYQIYPRSFADGNGDGIGDFLRMTAKLDHLRDRGVDGFRLDAVFTIFEHPDLPNHTATPSLADPLGLLKGMVGAGEEVPRSAADAPQTMASGAARAELRPIQPRLDWHQAAREFEELLHYQRHQPGVHELMQEL